MCLIEDQSWIDCIDITSRWDTFVLFHLYGNKGVSLPLWPIRPRWFHTFSPCAEPLGDGHEGMGARFGSQGSIALNWHSRYSGTRYSGTWLYWQNCGHHWFRQWLVTSSVPRQIACRIGLIQFQNWNCSSIQIQFWKWNWNWKWNWKYWNSKWKPCEWTWNFTTVTGTLYIKLNILKRLRRGGHYISCGWPIMQQVSMALCPLWCGHKSHGWGTSFRLSEQRG